MWYKVHVASGGWRILLGEINSKTLHRPTFCDMCMYFLAFISIYMGSKLIILNLAITPPSTINYQVHINVTEQLWTLIMKSIKIWKKTPK